MSDYPDDADGQVLSALAAEGVDMTQPLLVEYCVAAKDEASASLIGEALKKAGYETTVEFDDGEPLDEDDEFDLDEEEELVPSWTVYANVTMVPEYNEIIRIQKELDTLAAAHEGFADGWGVMIE